MGENQIEDTPAVFRVVVNDEGQYSIWPAGEVNPPGWTDAGKAGPKEDCLAYIETTWSDLRPLSLRRRTDNAEQEGLRQKWTT